MHGQSGGTTGIDNDFAGRSFENVGTWVLGRNMFGPVRGTVERRFLERLVGRHSSVPHARLCAHASRKGSPRDGRLHHVPLRHRRTGICTEESERRGQRQDVRIGGGGVSVIRQYLIAGQIDEMP